MSTVFEAQALRRQMGHLIIYVGTCIYIFDIIRFIINRRKLYYSLRVDMSYPHDIIIIFLIPSIKHYVIYVYTIDGSIKYEYIDWTCSAYTTSFLPSLYFYYIPLYIFRIYALHVFEFNWLLLMIIDK